MAVPLLLGACRDAPTDPMVGLVAEEAYAALALGVTFPDPAAWLDGNPASAEAQAAAQAWKASWDLPPEDGQVQRDRAYSALNAGLAQALEPARVEEEVTRLSEAVLRAQSLELTAVPPHIAQGLATASARSAEARTAVASGDLGTAVDALIRGGDALRQVGPEAIARALQSEVEGRLGRVSDDDPYTDQDLERLGRLVRGGRQALEEGDWGLAIRRAFYAKGLLDGNG